MTHHFPLSFAETAVVLTVADLLVACLSECYLQGRVSIIFVHYKHVNVLIISTIIEKH
jgi:hypothetical protein